MRRDRSLRLDLLSGAQLDAQSEHLAIEKERCEGLLMSMLPRSIIEALKKNEPVDPQHFGDVTVIFVEIGEFDRLCNELRPEDVVEVLNATYVELDKLSDILQVYKVETVKQVYMAVVGCPEPVVNHADVAAHFAVAAQRVMVRVRAQIEKALGVPPPIDPAANNAWGVVLTSPTSFFDSSTVTIRIGLNSGTIRAGVVGIDSPRYKLFGDTVNTASRMESTCEAGRVQVSPTTLERLTPGMFELEDRGEIPVKGKGYMRTSFLLGYSDEGKRDSCREVVIEKGSHFPSTSPDDEDGGYRTRQPLNKTSLPKALTQSITDLLGVGDQNAVSPLTPSSAMSCKTDFSALTPSSAGQTPLAVVPMSPTGMPPNIASSSPDDFMEVQGQKSITSGGLPTANLIGGVFGRENSEVSRSSPGPSTLQSSFQQLQLLFLLVPPSQKQPSWMHTLRRDLPNFMEGTLQTRISFARNLTITWLLMLAVLSGIDYFMDVLHEDLSAYRSAIVFRAVGNNTIGLAYLLLMTRPALSSGLSAKLTIAMLVAQGVSLLACGMIMYNNEPAIISLFGAYILFYKVCSISLRLVVCALAVVGYIMSEFVRCGPHGIIDASQNIGFLTIYVVFLACGVRLEEHLSHVSHYEKRCVEERVEDITRAKAAGSQLITNLLPAHVIDLVSEGVSPIAEHHACVTIIFTDIKGFTAYSSRIAPIKLVAVLNSMYSAFDEIIANWALYKVEIIGDAYFISAGCPADRGSVDPKEYAMRAVEVAMALQRTLPSVCDDQSVQMRVGLHTGPVTAGVVGKKGPRYHLFGSTVGYAEKMESHGIPGKVHISDTTHALLTEGGHSYDFEERNIDLEGEEESARTWLVNKSNAKVAFQIQKKLMTERRRSVTTIS